MKNHTVQYFPHFKEPSCSAPGPSVREAVRNLKAAIMKSPGDVLAQTDTDTRDFLYNWLKNNKIDHSRNLYTSQVMPNSPGNDFFPPNYDCFS